MLHKSDKDDENKYISLESAEIRHYFHQPHLLSVHDQHYCQGNVLTILQGRPSFRRRWLMRVRRARAALLKDQLRQSRITSYFNRTNFVRAPSETTRSDDKQPPTRNPRPLPTTDHYSLRQQRIYHFFPGRPPDLHGDSTDSSSKSSASK